MRTRYQKRSGEFLEVKAPGLAKIRAYLSLIGEIQVSVSVKNADRYTPRCAEAAPPPLFTHQLARYLTGRCRDGNDLLQFCVHSSRAVPDPASQSLLETALTRPHLLLMYKEVHHPRSHIAVLVPRIRILTAHTPLPQASYEIR